MARKMPKAKGRTNNRLTTTTILDYNVLLMTAAPDQSRGCHLTRYYATTTIDDLCLALGEAHSWNCTRTAADWDKTSG